MRICWKRPRFFAVAGWSDGAHTCSRCCFVLDGLHVCIRVAHRGLAKNLPEYSRPKVVAPEVLGEFEASPSSGARPRSLTRS